MIYDHPQAYELACSFRDVSAEVDVLRRWADGARHVLELAAGPAEHARWFARRGVAATALDLSPAMCA
ncbi:MAG: class I SAM-dependent methyltransferase, partial [Actinoallomurus sp.]